MCAVTDKFRHLHPVHVPQRAPASMQHHEAAPVRRACMRGGHGGVWLNSFTAMYTPLLLLLLLLLLKFKRKIEKVIKKCLFSSLYLIEYLKMAETTPTTTTTMYNTVLKHQNLSQN